jgi:thiol:disulfide interchange protein DsbD
MQTLTRSRCRVFLLVLFGVFSLRQASATRLNPVSWSIEPDTSHATPGSTALIHLRAQIEPGYHLYSATTPSHGPIRTTIALRNPPVSLLRIDVYQPPPNRHIDPTLNVPVETFEKTVDFPVALKVASGVADGNVTLEIAVRYQACSSELCLPPVTRTATAKLLISPGSPTHPSPPKGYVLLPR